MLNKDALYLLLFAFLFVTCISEEPVSKVNNGYLTGADGAKIYYRVIGAGQDTVVVIHGGPGAGINSILPSVKPLAREFVLIFYDQRGGGRSELPADTTKLQPQYFAEDLEAVRQHFGLKKMKVIAHSFGAVLTAQYALKYPNYLQQIVFHGATGPNLDQELRLRRAKAELSPPSPDTALSNRSDALLQKLLTGTASNVIETCNEYELINKKLAILQGKSTTFKGTTCEAPPEAVQYYYRYTAQLAPRYYDGWDFTTGLEQLTAPLLVIYGKKDSLMIPAQRSWADAVPNGHLLLVPEAGKSAFTDNPVYVFSAISDFFRKNVR